MPPLVNALAWRKDQWRIDSFKIVNDEPIVGSFRNEYRPGSYLHQWDATTWGKFSVIQMSDFHFSFMAPRDKKGQPLPHPWDVETLSSDTYLLRVSKKKEPGELSAYEDIDVVNDIGEPMLAEAYVAVIKAMGAAFHQEALARDKIEEFLKSRK